MSAFSVPMVLNFLFINVWDLRMIWRAFALLFFYIRADKNILIMTIKIIYEEGRVQQIHHSKWE